MDKLVPQGRFGRLARLAALGARGGADLLLGGKGAAESAAEALGNLRGLAAKIGQMASYVDGVVPEAQREAYELALGKLRAQAPSSPWSSVRQVVESELGAPLEANFATFSEQPLASASIGQVHAATLLDGSEVAVKVQHPGVDKAIESDLANAGVLEGMITMLGGRRFDAKKLLDVLRQRFREELDYRLEASRAQAFARAHHGDPRIRIPRVFEAASTRRVLTCEFVRGLSFEQACAAPVPERRAWAETLWRFTFKSMLGGALLHADPHPGNYFFHAGGAVTFLDYGCVQELASEHRARAARAHRCALAGDDAGFDEAAKLLLGTRPGAMEQLAIDYLRDCLQPLFFTPYRVTRPYAAQLLADMKVLATTVRKVPEHEVIAMPPHMLFVNRLQFGLYSVLARLEVDVDYAGVERAIFSELAAAERSAQL
jgi:predicted unusual protein kinase regulating ubiquinone biosynthesis (AarF/ABC1/UbiB family)